MNESENLSENNLQAEGAAANEGVPIPEKKRRSGKKQGSMRQSTADAVDPMLGHIPVSDEERDRWNRVAVGDVAWVRTKGATGQEVEGEGEVTEVFRGPIHSAVHVAVGDAKLIAVHPSELIRVVRAAKEAPEPPANAKSSQELARELIEDLTAVAGEQPILPGTIGLVDAIEAVERARREWDEATTAVELGQDSLDMAKAALKEPKKRATVARQNYKKAKKTARQLGWRD
jgi:hypothetical protein